MKKILMVIAAFLVFQATPAIAGPYEGGDNKGKMFTKKDTNGDGMISESEFIDHAKAKFKEMDKDGNGSISQGEAKLARESKREKMKEKREERKERRKEKMENAPDASAGE